MTRILESDARGALEIPPELLRGAAPGASFAVEVQGNVLMVRPITKRTARPSELSPPERAEAIRQWAELERPAAPALSDEALRREHIYD